MKIIIAIIIAITIFALIKSAIKANKVKKEIDIVSPPDNDAENNKEQMNKKG
ncbi:MULTISPECIES: hypothetical protein [Bacteroides]|jgi:large-conductance mechanosensitive channel|uniref:hypothetical protein n=1 Tax=Bacteroides TaxID=816 RepID=UPI00189E3431|nr:hypothetical protein [Bacteroides nordii]MCE8465847.1 hypothetical protein [Bacteroides nordii]UYU49757.1 hypothetical protein KQP55_03870 [Bacteroides nordii]DAZ20242.1 MAG TPA: hypothetical protein [Caudoviricetes sp.]